jgi:hypothetical protein
VAEPELDAKDGARAVRRALRVRGSAPLYKNGVLVGGLGVSGDGVDQDDFVTNAGAQGFQAPDNIRADRVIVDGVRLPYFKFPRNPTQ